MVRFCAMLSLMRYKGLWGVWTIRNWNLSSKPPLSYGSFRAPEHNRYCLWLETYASILRYRFVSFHYNALANGELYAWGWNDCGQCGDGTLEDKLSPVLIPRLDVVSVFCGGKHSMALTRKRCVITKLNCL
jgi:hypothetical protein